MSAAVNNNGVERVRESILLLLAQSGPLTAAEIYEKIDTVETRQLLYAQISFLKKEGKIKPGDKEASYCLAKPLKELDAEETVVESTKEEVYVKNETSTRRFTWGRLGHEHNLALVIKDDTAYISVRRIFTVTPALLREMADLIEANS